MNYIKMSYNISSFFLSDNTFLIVFVSLFVIASITLTAPYADLDFPSSESNKESWYFLTTSFNYKNEKYTSEIIYFLLYYIII